jgi:hypothetical protein
MQLALCLVELCLVSRIFVLKGFVLIDQVLDVEEKSLVLFAQIDYQLFLGPQIQL